jgi:predicted SAM-dependent methyltransferase
MKTAASPMMTANSTLLECHELLQENGSLRIMIAELLITNQELRWQLLAYQNQQHTNHRGK